MDNIRHTLRAAIINGAAMYNAEDGEACLKLFLSTGESVLAMMPAPNIAKAVARASGQGGPPMPLQERVWVLRSAFDSLLDELELMGSDHDGSTVSMASASAVDG